MEESRYEHEYFAKVAPCLLLSPQDVISFGFTFRRRWLLAEITMMLVAQTALSERPPTCTTAQLSVQVCALFHSGSEVCN